MLSQKILKTKIKDIQKDAKSLRDRIHTVVLHTACHAFAHRDVSLFSDLFRATRGVNRKQLVKFIQDNGLAKLNEDGSFSLNKKARDAAVEKHGTVDAFMAALSELPKWYADEDDAKAILKAPEVHSKLKVVADALENPKTAVDADGNEVTQDIVVDFAEFHKQMKRINDAVELRFAEAV